MRALVLGCGPAGLMAAHGILKACADYRQEVSLGIVSRKRKSTMYGAQYLHWPIPGVTPDPPRPIRYAMVGTPEQYRTKVYGSEWDGSVSPQELPRDHLGWDIRVTYDRLWSLYEESITDGEVSHSSVHSLISNGQPDIIINSVPRQALCGSGHFFGSTTIWAAGDAPDRGIRLPYRAVDETVVCNGTEDVAWYRMSRVFGHTTVEWPGHLRSVPVPTASQVIKPTVTNCDCHPQVRHVGRYGEWTKGVLSHTAYRKAYNLVIEAIK